MPDHIQDVAVGNMEDDVFEADTPSRFEKP